ncbi:hypothetical protein MLD38_014298 [Melastoma candidum]|uniref:Uncharacterized protein n=1 Tax=Melastoma candidum TaxID=119954 RepID=A0ACB9RCW8_9MYRT|nr:hypothetical protein MLD38_014298 [Melastoma candidum]
MDSQDLFWSLCINCSGLPSYNCGPCTLLSTSRTGDFIQEEPSPSTTPHIRDEVLPAGQSPESAECFR